MLDPESDIAEPLANAIRNHQKNLAAQDKAEKNVEVLRQLDATRRVLRRPQGR